MVELRLQLRELPSDPLLCLGTRVTLKISLAVGGVQYDAGTKLTVDKDLKWIAVESWD